MKKSELIFKCVVPNKNAGVCIRLALKNIGLIKNAEDDYAHYQFFAYDRGIIATTNADVFCLWTEPLMSYKDALKLIESVEPDAPEFDIKPFDRVLVNGRAINGEATKRWGADHFSHCSRDEDNIFICAGVPAPMLIKYSGNEALLGEIVTPAGWWECENRKPVWRTK